MLAHSDDFLRNLAHLEWAVPFPPKFAFWSALDSHLSPKLKHFWFFLPLTKTCSVCFCRQLPVFDIHLQWDSGHALCGATPHCVVSVLCKCRNFYLLLGSSWGFWYSMGPGPHSLIAYFFLYLAVELGQYIFGNSLCHRVLWQQGNFSMGDFGHCNWWLSKPRLFSVRGMP